MLITNKYVFVLLLFTFFIVSSCCFIPIVSAGYLDVGWTNITGYDGYSGGNKYWWKNKKEDTEVEPGATTGQKWDIEGFYLNDSNNLSLVGGFDFVNGESWVNSGDIFIDTNDDQSYWEYIIKLDFQNGTYVNYENDGTITYNKTHNGPSQTAGLDWTYKGGGIELNTFDMSYITNMSNNEVGGKLKGGKHNIVGVDLSFLGSDTAFNVFYTLECGNDTVVGSGNTATAVPEPITILLIGSGLLGFLGYRRNTNNEND